VARPRVFAQRDAKLLELIDYGLSYAELQERFGMSYFAVCKALYRRRREIRAPQRPSCRPWSDFQELAVGAPGQ
jgi:hypothetical protein